MRQAKTRTLIGAGVVLLLAGCGPASADAGSSPSTVQQKHIAGSVSIGLDGQGGDGNFGLQGDGMGCTGAGAYKDLTRGGQVVVAGKDGSTVAIGKLRAGNAVKSGTTYNCVFRFAVAVPAGKSFYTVKVPHGKSDTIAETNLGQPVKITVDTSATD